MKLATFERLDRPQPPRVGVLAEDGSEMIDLQAVAIVRDGRPGEALCDMLALLDAETAGRQMVDELLAFAAAKHPEGCCLPLDRVRLLAPLPVPRSIRDCMVFEQHLLQATRAVVRERFPPLVWLDAFWRRAGGRRSLLLPAVWYERPLYYKGNPRSVVGPDATVIWPHYTQRLDFELELGIVIGRRGRDIPAAEAAAYIAGYTIFNDFSARDVQLREMQGRLGPAKGKDFDTGNALGPLLVTPDEVPDPYDLRMVVRVNGQTWGEGHSGQMRYRFEELIAYVSQAETLYPGDFIAAGTVGNGCGLELDRWIQPGDEIELEVERLGVLRNRVAKPS